MQGDRKKRLSRQIIREVNDIVRRDFNIPSGIILTVTDARLTRDFKNCKIFYSIFMQDALLRESVERKISKMLRLKASYFKFVIGKNMRIKNIPDVVFEIDRTFERAARVEKILDEIAGKKMSAKKRKLQL